MVDYKFDGVHVGSGRIYGNFTVYSGTVSTKNELNSFGAKIAVTRYRRSSVMGAYAFDYADSVKLIPTINSILATYGVPIQEQTNA